MPWTHVIECTCSFLRYKLYSSCLVFVSGQLLHTFGKAVTADDMEKVMISFTPGAITERDFINLMASKLVLPTQARNVLREKILSCDLDAGIGA